MRARKIITVAALVAASSGLAACGSHHENGTGTSGQSSSTPTSQPPSSSSASSSHSPLVVNVNRAHGTYRMVVGQQLVVQVGTDVKVAPSKQSCTPAAPSAVLRPQCASGRDFHYVAAQKGTAQMSYTIRPSCSPGAACPAWIRQADFEIAVKSA